MSEPREIIIGPGQEVVVKASDPLVAVLEEIQGMGHPAVSLNCHVDGWWYCSSNLPGDKEADETYGDYADRVEAGTAFAATAMEAATARRDAVYELAHKRKEAP